MVAARRVLRHGRVGLLSLAVACGGAAPDAELPRDPAVYGWLSEVAWQPERFAALTDTEAREGWIALHAHRYEQAWAAFPEGSVGRARAAWQLAVLHEDLSRLAGVTYDQLFREWSERGLPTGSAAPVVATLAARCTGIGDAKSWAGEGRGHPTGELATAVAAGAWPWEVELAEDHPWRPAMRLHQAAREGDPSGLTTATRPALTEAARGFERHFHDPCLHRTLADVWTGRIAPGSEGARSEARGWADPLEGRFLSPWLGPQDLTADLGAPRPLGLIGVSAPSLRGLPTPGDADDPQLARETVRTLDTLLDRWQEELLTRADADGRAVLLDLGLVGRFRQEHLILRARAALLADKPQQALSLLQLARDASSREVGPHNAPQLFALLTEAELRLGRTREALDTLHVLTSAHPEVRALEEVAGDLAVLRGLDRRGDSREE